MAVHFHVKNALTRGNVLIIFSFITGVVYYNIKLMFNIKFSHFHKTRCASRYDTDGLFHCNALPAKGSEGSDCGINN
jgi:hypothetical protein